MMYKTNQNYEVTNEQWAACHGIIHAVSALAAGVGAGLAPVPGSDSAIIIPAQVTMIISLGKVFGIELTRSAAQSLMTANLASMAGKATVNVLTGWIPGVGNLVNAGTAAAITEALGWLIVDDFSKSPARAR